MRATGQKIGHRGRNLRVGPGRQDFESHRLAAAHRVHGQSATARNGLPRDHKHIEQELDAVFGKQDTRDVPSKLGLLIFQKPARHAFGIAEIDLRARRPGGAEGDPAKLQSAGRRLDAFLDQIERKGLGFLVLAVLHHLEPIDDRSDRTDQVVANPRAQKRSEIEGFKIGRTGHRPSPEQE